MLPVEVAPVVYRLLKTLPRPKESQNIPLFSAA